MQPDEGQAVEALLSGTRVGAYRALLRNRDYRIWFLAALAAGLGDWTGLFALQVLVTELSDPGSRLALFALGGIMMARLLPSVLVGPVAGVLADRYDRKRLMVTTNIARGGLFAAIAFSNDLLALFALTFFVECFSLLFLAAKDAALPVIVRKDHLTQANQLNLLVTYGTLPIGAVVATSMLAVAAVLRGIGVAGANATLLALLLNATAFVAAGLLLSRLRLPSHGRRVDAGESPGVMAELKEGVRFIRDLPLIRSLILGVVGVFFGGGVVVALGPEFVRTSLNGRGTDWFALMAAVGVGLLVGILAVAVLVRHVRKERLFPVTLTATAAIAVVVATLGSLRVAMVFGFALGAAAGISFVVGYTLLQEYTDDEVRGRTFAAFYTATRIAMFVALGLAPFLAGVVGQGTLIIGDRSLQMSGVRLVLLLGGVVALISALGAGRGMLRALRDARERRVRLPGNGPLAASGVFIAVEGVEGAGKSTQVRRLVDLLRSEGHDVVATREPGGAPVAERIRAVLLDPNSDGMEPRTEALLYAAARAEHVERVIQPALSEGKVVVCDRFVDSSLAYQGHARGLGVEDVFEINRWAIGGLVPDVVVLLYLSPDEGLERVRERAQTQADAPRLQTAAPDTDWDDRDPRGDRLEREGPEFHRRVAEGFLRLAKEDRRRYVIVDGSADTDTVARQIRSALHPWLPLEPARRGRAEQRARPDDDTPQAAG